MSDTKRWQDPNYQIFKRPTVKAGDRCRFTRYAQCRNIPSNRMVPGIQGVVKKIGPYSNVIVIWDGQKVPHSYHASFIAKVKP